MSEFHLSEANTAKWIKAEPYVDEYGIYYPVDSYFLEGYPPAYRLVMTADMFREAYKKYIQGKPG